MKRSFITGAALCLTAVLCHAADLTVVEDKGGISALPYYRSLNPEPSAPTSSGLASQLNPVVAQGLPIRTTRMTPGSVQGRVINAPGLQPLFLIGDDETSHRWILERDALLEQMQAVGLVVNVATPERLAVVKSWLPNTLVSPASGDDLSQRLGLNHYPVLITPTAIEQ
ncbi:integrating conjugative element protein [Pseudomonas quasicaspiana]|uniref:integrating conjugative element protein n=1 Tax=Pseudomonas quasicaspiana TaxID=2829821 RepID=UPI001E5416AC|nr:integrating conjugative element protein [Pseudomonas quasicaspiana]MCD5975308.1 integrating conjugative element protein [Pseudomonas quasicaspiana]